MRCALLVLFVAAVVLPHSSTAQSATQQKPTLVVLLAVDQLRPDYFERFQRDMVGGFRRLHAEGAYFTESQLDYAISETAPGHAGMLSGRFPRSHGIVRNTGGIQDPRFPVLGDAGIGASPFRFRGSTLFDWMRIADPRARALAVSRKDRGAILPIGRSPEQVYWYTRGIFTTSTYYTDTLPAWVRRFNERRLPQQTAGREWNILLGPAAYSERDSVPEENYGRDFKFPHWAPADSAMAADSLIKYPWMDEITLALALEGVRALNLGAGPQTDLLTISLSATDYISHRFGPYSQEAHDQFVRLDRTLRVFFDSLFALRDRNRIIIALTADHGAAPASASNTVPARDQRVDLRPVLSKYRKLIAARGVDSLALDFDYGMVTAEPRAFALAGVSRDSITLAFLADARQTTGVLRADDLRSLARADTVRDVIARRWLHMLPRDLPVVGVVTPQPNNFWRTAPDWVNHGTPHDYDNRVPVLFWGTPFRPGRYDGRARAVDIAPTLAEALGISATEVLDGQPLRRALR